VAEVKFDLDGFAFVGVYIRMQNTPTMAFIEYKVDTGANRTAISRDLLNNLGYDDSWIRTGKLLIGDDRPTVATGEPIDDCYNVALPEIHIGGCVGYNWPFLTSLSKQFRYLLGTDTMRFFNWEFNYERDTCRFELIPGMRKTLFNQKEQSIHSMDEINNNHKQLEYSLIL
jgi:hypothetical protein